MILFNADDYGITETQSRHILECRSGCLTGVSVMPNSPFLDKAIEAVADDRELYTAVHLNLTEGLCLSDPSEIPLLARPTGRFYPSFGRLLLISLSPRRGALRAQMQRELTKQIVRVRELLPDRPLRLDGHQHIQMIPAVADAIARSVLAGGWQVEHMRWSCEPLWPYLRRVSFWKDYRPVNVVKNIVLNTLSVFARRHMRRMGLRCNLAMGLVISGDMELRFVRALLPDMERIAARRGKDLELVMHPGWGIPSGEGLDVPGGVFEKFYLDPGRKKEYDCLRELFRDMYENRDDNFGNGRDVRNRFEDVISRQANRLAEMDSPTKEDLMTIIKADLLTAEEMAEYEAENGGEPESRDGEDCP